MLNTAIDSMQQNFDSHEVIREVSRANQVAYIDQLHGERYRQAPFQYVHARLGEAIALICSGRQYIRKDDRSAEMFGQHSKCIAWQQLI